MDCRRYVRFLSGLSGAAVSLFEWMMNRIVFCGALGTIAFLLSEGGAHAQSLEPRSYTNSPVGLNFLLAGYGYYEGKIAFDPALPVADAQFQTHKEYLAYARSLDVFGNSAKFDVVLPYSSFSGKALVGGQLKQREMSGFDDPHFRLSVNFYGAPALSLKEFSNYRQDLIVGASLEVVAPLGNYENSKLINIGTNRWSFKPEMGISKAWGSWTVEVIPSVTFYTQNTDFIYGGTLSQAPIYAVQGHIIHTFQSGIWLALDGTYYTGGRTTINGVKNDNAQTITRAGMTLALPMDRLNSIKINASTGTTTNSGAEFKFVGIVWQHRWGGGL